MNLGSSGAGTSLAGLIERLQGFEMPAHPIIAEDIRGVLSRTQSLWPVLKGVSGFIVT